MDKDIKLLDVVALTEDIDEYGLCQGRLEQLLRCFQMVKRLKLNFVAGKVAPMNQLVYIPTSLSYYTMRRSRMSEMLCIKGYLQSSGEIRGFFV